MPIISSGWETGEITDGGIWVKVGSPTVVTSPVHHGTYAMQCTAVRYFVYKMINQATFFMRVYIRFTSFPSLNTRANEVTVYNGSYDNNVILYIYGSASAPNFFLDVPSGDYDSGVSASLNTWYCLEIERKVGAGNGIANLWIDGVLKVEKTTETITGNAAEIDVGISSYTGAHTCVVDCAVGADAYIGPEAVEGGQPYISRVQEITGMKSWSRSL